jgi:hypothetical protein
VGIRPEQVTGADRLVTATAGTLVFTLGLGTDASPELAITVPDVPRLVVPSGAPSLEPGRRYLVSASVVPRQDGLLVRWFIDGRQVSEAAAVLLLPRTGAEGSAVVGGTAGLAAVIDELGVYQRDEAGRRATDPTLFREAMRKLHGDRVLLADGFDGMFLPSGFTASAKTALGSGRVSLPPEASIELPPIRFPADGFSIAFELGSDSERSANVRLSWAGTGEALVDERLAAESGAIRLEFSGEASNKTVTALTADGVVRRWDIGNAPAEKAGIVLRAACPRDARSPLVISEIVALTTNEKQ